MAGSADFGSGIPASLGGTGAASPAASAAAIPATGNAAAATPDLNTLYQAQIANLQSQLADLQDPNKAKVWKANYLQDKQDPVLHSLPPTALSPDAALAAQIDTVNKNLLNTIKDAQAAQNASKASTPEQQQAVAQAGVTTAQAGADYLKQLQDERQNPAHPGQTNAEDRASGLESTRITSEQAVQMMNARAQLLLGQKYASDSERADAIFEYGKFKDKLDAAVAANDKAVAAQLAQQKLEADRRGQDITQRGQDVSAFSNLTQSYAHDLAPVGAYGDLTEALKQYADPNYKPNYTGTGATPYDPAAMVSAAMKQYAPAQIGQPSLAAAIASSVANAPNPAATPTITAPALGTGPANNTLRPPVTNSVPGYTTSPAYNPATGFSPGS